MTASNENDKASGNPSHAAKATETLDTSLEATAVTTIFSDFIASLSFESLPTHVVNNLKTLVLDYIGIGAFAAAKAESSEPFHRAIQAFSGGAQGNCTTITKGRQYLPQYAALLSAAYSHTLDFDDTFAPGALHPGAPVISAALAEAEASSADGKTLLTGLAAGYEVICRLSKGLGAGAYERGFHNTSTAGIFGAVAAIMKIRGVNSQAIQNAFGLAGSKAAGSQQYLENGAWNKRLHPGFSAHDAFMCIDLSEKGVSAATKPIEGVFGFLKGYSSTPTTDGMVDGLGKEWVHTATAIKPYPGCRMTHTAIDLGSKWRKAKTCSVKSLRLSLSPHCWMIVGRPVPNKLHPENIVDAQFSAHYQLALAWLDGSKAEWAVYDRNHDKDVSELLNIVTVDSADDLIGLAGRLDIQWEDGTTTVDKEDEPVGEPSNPMTEDQVQQKFSSLSSSVYGGDRTGKILRSVKNLEGCGNIKEVMGLLI